MSEALVSQLARALNLPPDAARHTLDHLVTTLREQIDASGRAKVPGLGTFVRDEDGLTFRPDDALARAVNHRYAGLRPITAGSSTEETEPEPEDPFAKAAPSASDAAVGFQPLDSLVEPEAEPEPEVAAEPATEAPPAVEEDAPDADVLADNEDVRSEEEAFVSEPPAEEVLDEATLAAPPLAVENEFEDDEAESTFEDDNDLDDDTAAEDITAEEEIEAYGLAIDAEEEEGAEEEGLSADATAEVPLADATFDDLEIDDDDVDDFAEPDEVVIDETDVETEAIETEGDDLELDDDLEPETEEAYITAETQLYTDEDDEEYNDTLDSLDDLSSPDRAAHEADVEDDEEDITAILPVMTGGAEPTTESSEAHPPEATTAAPAFAATSRDPEPHEPAKPSPRRGRPVAPILIGVAAVLGIVALLWFLSREPDAPDIAERPIPADTTTVAEVSPPATDPGAPADTTTPSAETPPEPAAAADPLRSSGGIDRTAGGFSWVVGSELSREPAQRRVDAFRAQGMRADVIAEEAAGRTRYRVALGQFESIEQAERFRSDLPAGVPDDTWLLRL